MSKAKTVILDLSVTSEIAPKTRNLRSMTNKAYKKDVNKVNRIIEENNKQFVEAETQAAKLVIKYNSTNGLYSNNNEIENLQRIANDVKCDGVSEVLLNKLIESSLIIVKKEDVSYQYVDIRNNHNPVTVKPYNIYFNLRDCFDLLYTSYVLGQNVIEKDYFKLFISILKFIRSVMKVTTVNLTDIEVVVLSYLVKLGGVVREEALIKEIVADSRFSKNMDVPINNDKIYVAITNLEKLNVIDIESGKIRLVEKVLI